MANYRLIQEVRVRVISDNNGSTVYENYDETGKIEYADGTETYENGFSDYHGGSRED